MKQTSKEELSVAFWNILSDVHIPSLVKSQAERLPNIMETLQNLPEDTIIGLAEVEGSNGKLIAQKLNSRTDYFVEHDRNDDHIGILSRSKLSPTFISVDEKCKAIFVQYEGINIIIVHMTLVLHGDSFRQKQIETLLAQIDHSLPTIIMGDFNSMSWQKSRKLLRKAGFYSALGRSITKRVPTAPTPKYLHIFEQPLRTLVKRGLSLDDIYIKGVRALDSGTFEGESDHRGVWARLRLP
jgi:hypothetical protein